MLRNCLPKASLIPSGCTTLSATLRIFLLHSKKIYGWRAREVAPAQTTSPYHILTSHDWIVAKRLTAEASRGAKPRRVRNFVPRRPYAPLRHGDSRSWLRHARHRRGVASQPTPRYYAAASANPWPSRGRHRRRGSSQPTSARDQPNTHQGRSQGGEGQASSSQIANLDALLTKPPANPHGRPSLVRPQGLPAYSGALCVINAQLLPR